MPDQSTPEVQKEMSLNQRHIIRSVLQSSAQISNSKAWVATWQLCDIWIENQYTDPKPLFWKVYFIEFIELLLRIFCAGFTYKLNKL